MTKILNLNDRPELLTVLAHWHQQQWSYLNPGETLEQRIDRMQEFLDDDLIPSTYIAMGDTLLGSAALVRNDMDTNTSFTPWLASVFVLPEYRNQGIGSSLVRHVMQQARQGGIDKLFLYTPDSSAFYRSLGWNPVITELYQGHEVTIMEADLTKARD